MYDFEHMDLLKLLEDITDESITNELLLVEEGREFFDGYSFGYPGCKPLRFVEDNFKPISVYDDYKYVRYLENLKQIKARRQERYRQKRLEAQELWEKQRKEKLKKEKQRAAYQRRKKEKERVEREKERIKQEKERIERENELKKREEQRRQEEKLKKQREQDRQRVINEQYQAKFSNELFERLYKINSGAYKGYSKCELDKMRRLIWANLREYSRES